MPKQLDVTPERKPSGPYTNIELEWGRADHVVVLRFCRPSARNAINRATMKELDAALDELAAAPQIRAVVLAAEGERAFIAGGDLKDFRELDTPQAGAEMSRRMAEVLSKLAALRIPSIAAIANNAYGGGCEVAMACDLRVMSAGAHLVFNQARMGLMTGWGGGPRLVRAIGPGRALRILLTGAYVSAEEAKTMGLAELAPQGLALAHALDLARQITRHPAGSIEAIKQLVWGAVDRELPDAIALENALFATRWCSEEHRTAVQEFLQRRPPAFDTPSES